MKIVLSDIRKIVMGLTNSMIKVGYGSWLRLGFGEKIYYDQAQSEGKYLYDINISSINSTWRISRNEEIICTNDDEVKFCDEALSGLTLGKVSCFEEASRFDMRITFDSGISIDFFSQSKDGSNLLVLDYRKRISYELYSDGWDQSEYKGVVKKLTKIDEELDLLSKDCHDRWQRLVPQKEDENECDNCFYFRGFSGHFHFLNYGICCNGESTHDGTLVGFKSGCSKHKQLKELT